MQPPVLGTGIIATSNKLHTINKIAFAQIEFEKIIKYDNDDF